MGNMRNAFQDKFQELFNVSYDPWISVEDGKPNGLPIVFMYSESNNEYSVGHFTLERAGVRVTHWQPLVPPRKKE